MTGASGFVGGHVARELAQAGLDVIGLYRAPPKAVPTGARVRILERWDARGLRDATRGMRGVVHAAATVHVPDLGEGETFNAQGTADLVDAARREGVSRFVHLSTIKVHGETPSNPIDERTALAPMGAYAIGKAAAERTVLDVDALRPVVLRLCPVYGRGDRGNVQWMAKAIARRRFAIPGDGSSRKSIVHVSAVARAVRAAASSSARGVLVLADPVAPTVRVLADTIASALHRRPPIALPLLALRAATTSFDALGRRFRFRLPMAGDLLAKATTSTICDPSRIQRELGIDCAVDLRAAIADEIAWLRDTGEI